MQTNPRPLTLISFKAGGIEVQAFRPGETVVHVFTLYASDIKKVSSPVTPCIVCTRNRTFYFSDSLVTSLNHACPFIRKVHLREQGQAANHCYSSPSQPSGSRRHTLHTPHLLPRHCYQRVSNQFVHTYLLPINQFL